MLFEDRSNAVSIACQPALTDPVSRFAAAPFLPFETEGNRNRRQSEAGVIGKRRDDREASRFGVRRSSWRLRRRPNVRPC